MNYREIHAFGKKRTVKPMSETIYNNSLNATVMVQSITPGATRMEEYKRIKN